MEKNKEKNITIENLGNSKLWAEWKEERRFEYDEIHVVSDIDMAMKMMGLYGKKLSKTRLNKIAEWQNQIRENTGKHFLLAPQLWGIC